MDFDDLILEQDDHVAIITLNRPQVMNAISPRTHQELIRAIGIVRDTTDIWAAIITGAGERAFCAGADIKWQYQEPEQHEQMVQHRDQTKHRNPHWHLESQYIGELPRDCWKPIIAAVNGYALGGGLELALHCDIIVASENARFGLPEVTRGWTSASGNFLLPRHIPQNIAMEMLLTGDPISAERAYEVGLVNSLVAADELLDAAMALANCICENPPLAVQAVKQLALRGLDMPLNYAPVAWHLLSENVIRVVEESEDREEGRRAFAEKRKPQFRGK